MNTQTLVRLLRSFAQIEGKEAVTALLMFTYSFLAMMAHNIIARSHSLFGGVGPSQDFESGGVPLKAQNYFHRLGPAAFQAVRLYEKPQGRSPAISICRAWLDPVRSNAR